MSLVPRNTRRPKRKKESCLDAATPPSLFFTEDTDVAKLDAVAAGNLHHCSQPKDMIRKDLLLPDGDCRAYK